MTQPVDETDESPEYTVCKTWCKEHYEIPSEEYEECIDECEEFWGDDEDIDQWAEWVDE